MATASDASETGGGACFASRLSRLGVEELEKLMDAEGPIDARHQENNREQVAPKNPGLSRLLVERRKERGLTH